MFRIATYFYSVLYTIALIFYGPFRVLRSLVRGQSIGIMERLGNIESVSAGNREGPTIWLHAVSVGEVNAAKSLVNALSGMGCKTFVSTTTETGQEQARKLFREKAEVFYFPLDWKPTCRKCLKKIQPDVVLLVETELWPNFIMSTRDLNIPLVLVNGRISDQSFLYYSKIRFIIKPLLDCFSHLCMQSQQDLERIQELGAPPGRTSALGNLKFDYQTVTDIDKKELKQSIEQILKEAPENLLLICGSTKPGEEGLLLTAYENLHLEFPTLRLLIAPRHPHRGAEVTALVKERGFSCIQRSKDPLEVNRTGPAHVLVLDSIGELASTYELGDLVFVGGSLVPMGGQNIIEAAAYGKAILFGPHMQNFRQVARAFLEARAAVQVTNPTDLLSQLRYLIGHPDNRKELGSRALEVVRLNRGSVERTMAVVRNYIPE